MVTIGFGGTFYTLWDVKSERVEVALGASYKKITCTYLRNLSKNLGEAIEKAGTDNVDEALKGKRSSFEYKTITTLVPELITERHRLWGIICINAQENKVEGVRLQAFEQAKKLGYLTEVADDEGANFQWNGELRDNDGVWESIGIRFRGVV